MQTRYSKQQAVRFSCNCPYQAVSESSIELRGPHVIGRPAAQLHAVGVKLCISSITSMYSMAMYSCQPVPVRVRHVLAGSVNAAFGA
jgi:hypothetical protein